MTSLAATKVKLTELLAPSFYGLHWEIREKLYSAFWLAGGRGSTKSSFVAAEILLGMIDDPLAWGVALRKIGNTLRDSILSTFEWAINKLQMSLFWKVTSSPAEVVYLPTGQKVICRGLDEPLKLKSIKAAFGYFKYLWFEEGQEYDGLKEMRSVRQSVLRGGKVFCEFVTFNPPEEEDHWINVEAAAKVRDRRVHESCYLDVPKDWLGPKFLDDAKDLEERDPLTYQNEYLGKKVGNRPEVIFAGKMKSRIFDVQPHWDGPYYGCDWGFSTDPLTITKMWIETIKREGPEGYVDKESGKFIKFTPRMRLYVEQSEAETNVDLDDMAPFFDRFPGIRQHTIRCDSARPDLISYMKRQGFDCIGAEKGDGSVETGLIFLLNFIEIVMHTTKAATHVEEGPKYKYKIDPLTKKVTRKPVDKDNHHWDADRYGLEPIIKVRNSWF